MSEKRVSRVTIEIDEVTRRRLRILAAHEGVTVKELVRRLVAREWERRPR